MTATAVTDGRADTSRGAASKLAESALGRRAKGNAISLLAILLVAAGVYALPWIASSSENRSGLPGSFGPDSYAYLTLSHVCRFDAIADRDPWYGVPVQPKFGHSVFRGAFVLFGAMRSVLGNDLVTSIAWSICWSALIALSLWLLLRELFPRASAVFLFAASSLLVFVNLSTLKVNFLSWFHLLSGRSSYDLPLPFIRMFFPQIAVPLLAFYFLCCKKAWGLGRARDYVALVLIQIAVFISFPYASVLLGLATFVFLLLIAKRVDWRKRVVPFGVVGLSSLLADAVYVWLALRHAGPAHPGQPNTPLFHLDLSQLRMDFGGTVVLLLGMTALLLFIGRKDSSRSLLASIGLANAVMLLADCLVDPGFLVSHHAGYFVQISLGLEFCALAYWAADFISPPVFKVAAAGVSLFFVANGVLAARAAVQANAETNSKSAKFAAVIRGLNLSSEDLLISPAENVDDVGTFVPLLSEAHALYTPEAEILLGPGDEKLIDGRHAVYLFLSGRDSTWVESQLSKHLLPAAMLTLGQRVALQYHRRPDLAEKEVRENLIPQLVSLDNGSVPEVLSGSRRIVILDETAHPTFDASHIDRLLGVSERYAIDGIRVQICSAAPAKN